MPKIITNTIFLLSDLFIFVILCLILLGPFLFITVYKRFILFIGNKIFKRKLIPFDGLEICNFQLLRTDLENITLMSANNNNNNSLANVVGIVMTYKCEPISLEHIRNLFHSKFIDTQNIKPANKFINFQVKVVKFGGYLFKEKVEIYLKKQICSVNLPDSITLEEFCADWYVGPFKPASNGLLWEIALINSQNVKSVQNESYIALKIHHCLADGYTIRHIVDVLCGKEIKPIVGDYKSSIWENIYTSIRAPRALLKFIKELEAKAKDNVQLKKLNYKIHVSFGTLDLRKVKEIRAKTNVKFQCILQSFMVGAVREFYLSKKLPIPDFAVLYGVLPWPNHPCMEKMTNWACGIVFISPVNEENPSKRLRDIEIQLELCQTKGLNKMFVQILGNLFSLFPHFLCKYWQQIQPTTGFSTLVFENDYELLGRNIIHIHAMGGIQQTVIGGASVSQSNKLDYTIIANKDRISQQELERIKKDFIPNELNKLYEYELFGYESVNRNIV